MAADTEALSRRPARAIRPRPTSKRMVITAGDIGKCTNSAERYELAVAADTVDVHIASNKVAVAPTTPIVLPENWRRYM